MVMGLSQNSFVQDVGPQCDTVAYLAGEAPAATRKSLDVGA